MAKFKDGDIIKITNNEKPDGQTKYLRTGTYTVLKLRESFVADKTLVYDLKSTRKGASYIFVFYTDYIDNISVKLT